MIEVEFAQGYRDGRDADAPEPSDNRSHSYRHSFAIGRAEAQGKPIAAHVARNAAAIAEQRDTAIRGIDAGGEGK